MAIRVETASTTTAAVGNHMTAEQGAYGVATIQQQNAYNTAQGQQHTTRENATTRDVVREEGRQTRAAVAWKKKAWYFWTVVIGIPAVIALGGLWYYSHNQLIEKAWDAAGAATRYGIDPAKVVMVLCGSTGLGLIFHYASWGNQNQ